MQKIIKLSMMTQDKAHYNHGIMFVVCILVKIIVWISSLAPLRNIHSEMATMASDRAAPDLKALIGSIPEMKRVLALGTPS